MRETEPNDYRADLYLGHAAIEQHDPNRAEEHYRAALAKQPTSREVLLALGQLQMQEKRFEAAAGFFERVIELGDRQALVHYNHVLALMRTPGREQEAEAALAAAGLRAAGDQSAGHPAARRPLERRPRFHPAGGGDAGAVR